MLSIFDSIPSHMDFVGQKKAEKLFQTMILVFAVAGLVVGYHFEQFSFTVYALGLGFAVSCLLTLPPWPMYRRNPLKWQKVPKAKATKDQDDLSPSSPSSSKGKKKK